MAIVQISRITQRKGLQENLPQLAGGELGWSIDTRKLYIGNGTLEEGAPIIGNTEILTEFTDLLELSEFYTYKGLAAGYTVQTGPTPGTPVTQSLQSWMDQFATIKDFGAVGDGVTDDTAAINRAIFQIYCREVNPQIRRSLFFPAGVYKISDTIVIPPYATLYGEGADNSVLNFVVTAWTNTVAYSPGTLVSYGGSYYRSVDNVPSGVAITNTDYWDPTVLPSYVVRTGDSLQQTGANIGTNGATPPKYINVMSLGFTSADGGIDVMLVEDASNCDFTNVKFSGPRTTAELTTDSNPITALQFASTPSLVTSKINFENCLFSGCTYGINTAAVMNSTVVAESRFETLFKGIVLTGSNPGVASYQGPTGFRVMHNSFDSIYAESIIYDDVQLNATGYNMFYDVGNHFGGPTQPFTVIIDITYANNISVGDMFEREDQYSTTHPRIRLNDQASIAFTNAAQLAMGTYVRETGKLTTLADNAISPTNIFTVSSVQTSAFCVDYTIVRDDAFRTGRLTVTAGSGPNSVTYTDDYTENANTGITLSITQAVTTVSLRYTSTASGFAGQFYYSITQLA